MEMERSGFTYIPQKEENKSWDQFVQTEFSSGSASEKHTDFIKKVTPQTKALCLAKRPPKTSDLYPKTKLNKVKSTCRKSEGTQKFAIFFMFTNNSPSKLCLSVH